MHRLTSFAVPEGGPWRRSPPRPPHQRDESYLAKFDDCTVFYDVFRDPAGVHALAVGPPPLDLGPKMRQMSVRADAGGARLPFALLEQPRLAHWRIRCGANARQLLISGLPEALPPLTIQPNHCDLFAGRRAIVTINKNNDLLWVADWARFYRRAHGADAFLLYDNGSTLYSVDELRAAVAAAAGEARCEVVAWPFKFGPEGGPAGVWDSNFCQCGMLQHARWRYLVAARSILNVDIDELVMSPQRDSIFAATERSALGFTAIASCWMTGLPPAARVPRFTDFLHRRRIPQEVPKWCIDPRRCPPARQWLVHRVEGFDVPAAPEAEFLIRHYWSITTGWKPGRLNPTPADVAAHVRDDVAAAQLADYLAPE